MKYVVVAYLIIVVPFRQNRYKVPEISGTFLPNVKFQNARGKGRYLTSSCVADGVGHIGPRPVVLSLPLLCSTIIGPDVTTHNNIKHNIT